MPGEASVAAAASARFWYLTGRLSEGRAWLEKALAVAPRNADRTKSTLAWMLAVLAWVQGDLTTARDLALSGSELAESAGDERGYMRCIETLALCEMDEGLLTDARRHLEDNLIRSRAMGDDRGVAVTSGNLARLALFEENYEDAALFAKESVALHRAKGDSAAIATSLAVLGLTALFTDEIDTARTSLQEALVLASWLGHSEQIATAMEGYACAMARAGANEQAALLLGTVDRIKAESGVASDPIEAEMRGKTEQILEDSMGREQLRELFLSGQKMSIKEVLAGIEHER